MGVIIFFGVKEAKKSNNKFNNIFDEVNNKINKKEETTVEKESVIVNEEKRRVGIGYNGFPVGCDDKEFPWGRDGDFLDTKYPYVVHAEPNAILNSNSNTRGCTLYVSLFPCNECAKLIVQSGIKEIIYLSDKHKGDDNVIASKKLLDVCGINYHLLKMDKKIDVVLENDK